MNDRALTDGSPRSASTATPRSPSADGDGWQRVNPALAQYVQLDDLNVTLAQVLDELRVRPHGVMVPFSDTQAGSVPTLIWMRELPLFGFSLVNDGPADLEYDVGGRQSWCVLKTGESIQTDFRQPIVDRIAFRCAPGRSAAWRLTGIR